MTIKAKNWNIPYCESPFFDLIFSDTKHPWYRYARDMHFHGYTIIKKDSLFETSEISDKIVRDLRSHFQYSSIPRRIQDFIAHSTLVHSVANHEVLLELLTYLYGKRAFPFQTLHFSKGSEQHFHSDAVHFNSIPERYMCGVWLALEDITKTQGPLEYYPGSHRLPIYGNEHLGIDPLFNEKLDQKNYESLWEELVDAHKLHSEIFEAEKGDMLIWASNLLHGGTTHHDDTRTRFSQVTHYYFEDCSYYVPIESDLHNGFIKNRLTTTRNKLSSKIGQARDELVSAFNKSYNNLINQSKGLPKDFDPNLYLELHKDVRDGGMDPAKHFIQFGLTEGRKYKHDER